MREVPIRIPAILFYQNTVHGVFAGNDKVGTGPFGNIRAVNDGSLGVRPGDAIVADYVIVVSCTDAIIQRYHENHAVPFDAYRFVRVIDGIVLAFNNCLWQCHRCPRPAVHAPCDGFAIAGGCADRHPNRARPGHVE